MIISFYEYMSIIISIMPIPAHQWLQGQTLSNGFCGYHSLAEAFVRIARNRPELINAQLFNQDNPMFKPIYDFLRHSLNIPGELTPGLLQATLFRDDIRFNGAFIAQHIAPAMFVLALTHYRNAIAPARAEFLRQEPGLGFHIALELAAELAMRSLQQHDPFGGIGANRDIERAHYVEYLSLAIYNWEEEHALIQENAQIPLVANFLNSHENSLNPAIAAEFTNLVYNQGLNAAQLPTISIFDNLCRLIFRPIAIEADNGVAAPIPYYPVSVVSEPFLSLPHHPAPHEVIAAVYRCSAGAHFQYALPPLCVQQFGETVSSFNPVERRISGKPSFQIGTSSKKSNKMHHAILQKQALAKVRAEKHAQFMEQSEAKTHSTELSQLHQNIQSIESQIRSAQASTQQASSKKERKKTNKKNASEVHKLQDTLAVLKRQESQLVAKNVDGSCRLQKRPLTFSTQKAEPPFNLSREKEAVENEIRRLTLSNKNNQNQAEIETLQFQLKQLQLIERELGEENGRQTASLRSALKPALSNTIFPKDAGRIGRIINYVIEQLVEFFMKTVNELTGNPTPRINRFGL